MSHVGPSTTESSVTGMTESPNTATTCFVSTESGIAIATRGIVSDGTRRGFAAVEDADDDVGGTGAGREAGFARPPHAAAPSTRTSRRASRVMWFSRLLYSSLDASL